MVEGTVMVMALLLIVVSTGLIIATKDLKEKIRKYRQIESHLSVILTQATQILADNPNFSCICNEPETGKVCYKSNSGMVALEFSNHPDKFDGFFMNGHEIGFGVFVNTIKHP